MKGRMWHVRRLVGLLVTGGGLVVLIGRTIEQVLR
jgi:hypothetical protein